MLSASPQHSFPNTRVPSRCRSLMTRRALLRSWRIYVLAALDDLVVTTGAVAMESLLVGQRDEFGSYLKLDLRNLWQQLRFFINSRMAVATDGADSAWVLCADAGRLRRRRETSYLPRSGSAVPRLRVSASPLARCSFPEYNTYPVSFVPPC